MKKTSNTFRIFDFIRSQKAVTRQEICQALNLPETFICRYIDILLSNGLIKQGDPIQSTTRKCARIKVIGLTESDIKQKERMLLENISEEKLLTALYNKVYTIIKGLQKGFTPYDVLIELQKERPEYNNLEWVATVLRDLWKRKLLVRSPFRIPPECLGAIKSKRGTYVYGANHNVVTLKVLELAPKEVRDAFFRIENEAKVFASFYLKQLTGISITEDDKDEGVPLARQWLINRFYKSNWIKYKSYKQMGYFWRNSLPQDMADAQIREIHPKACEYRLQCVNVGRMSERRALFVFVAYATLVWKRNIPLYEGFPHRSPPSWFNPKDIEKYTEVITVAPKKEEADTNVEVPAGTLEVPKTKERRILKSGIWKFDLNPLDFIILEAIDPRLNLHPSGFGLNCKFTSKKIGEFPLMTMDKFLRDGFVYKYRTDKVTNKKKPTKIMIPQGGCLKPVILCKNTFGGIVWQRARDTGAIIITLNKLKEMEEYLETHFGIVYSDSNTIDKMLERMRLFEIYQQKAIAEGSDPVKMVKEAIG